MCLRKCVSRYGVFVREIYILRVRRGCCKFAVCLGVQSLIAAFVSAALATSQLRDSLKSTTDHMQSGTLQESITFGSVLIFGFQEQSYLFLFAAVWTLSKNSGPPT